MTKKIAIAGMGWLGKPLAVKLGTLGYRVKGSVTSLKKASSLQSMGFDVYPLKISEDGVAGEPKGFLKEVDVLIVMIPPGLRRHTGADYVLKMSHFLSTIEASGVEKVILISSTFVYSDTQGKVTEKDMPKPTTEAGKQLFQVEQLYFNAPFIETAIVRFGGLYGGSRQPVKYLAGRTDLHGGDAPVNLIHRDDCIGVLISIIKNESYNRIFNAVLPEHPAKRDYYKEQAKILSLTPPEYSVEDDKELYKQVDSVNLKHVLNYNFIHSL